MEIDYKTRAEKLDKLNKDRKPSKCKKCGGDILFLATNIVINPFSKKEQLVWACYDYLDGCNSYKKHHETCLGTKDYIPKFKKGDTILSRWKNHQTMYTVDKVCEDRREYSLFFRNEDAKYKKYGRQYSKNIPIKAIDSKSSKCNEELVGALFD